MNETNSKPLISVVIPSYNDEPIIRPFYTVIVETLESQKDYEFELIYIDDGSSDKSQVTLAELAAQDSRVTFIEFYRNFGQTQALFAGLSISQGDYVVTIDGDYQYPPEAILQLVSAMEGKYDMASGIRVNRQDGWLEIFTAQLATLSLRKIFKVNIQDFGSVKAISRSLAEKVLKMRHRFCDVNAAALSLRPSLVEVEVLHKARPSGDSHWNFWMRLKFWLNLYTTYSEDYFQTPCLWGFLISLLGILSFFITVLQATLNPTSGWTAPIFSFMIFIFGFILMTWSATMYLLVRLYKQNVFTEPYVIKQIYPQNKEAFYNTLIKDEPLPVPSKI